MSNIVTDCFGLLQQTSEKLKEIESDIKRREDELVHKIDELQSREAKLEDDKHELEAFNKVSMYNQLNKKIEMLENENRLLKRSQELRSLYNSNSEKRDDSSMIEMAEPVEDVIPSGQIEEIDQMDQMDQDNQPNTQETEASDPSIEDKSQLEGKLKSEDQEDVIDTNDANHNAADEKEVEVEVSDNEEEEEEEEEEDLETIQHEGKSYHTDGNYLYDINTGDAVAYKRGKNFKFYKKAKK